METTLIQFKMQTETLFYHHQKKKKKNLESCCTITTDARGAKRQTGLRLRNHEPHEWRNLSHLAYIDI